MNAQHNRESWFDQVKQAAPDVLSLAPLLHLTAFRRRFGPCPACHADDHRHPPCTPRHEGGGWMCAHCKATGDSLSLAAWVITGSPKPDGIGWATVRALMAGQGWCQDSDEATAPWVPPTPAPVREPDPYPDPDELRAMLTACRCVSDVPDVRAYCDQRGFGADVPARVIPDVFPWPKWWPHRPRVWRLAVSAVDAKGVIRSMHARATIPTDAGKTRWPEGCRADRLLFADPWTARPMLTGACKPGRVIILEGITDYLAYASRRLPDLAVLGATSGGFPALADAAIPSNARIYLATDDDDAGNRYAEQVAEALAGRELRRVTFAPKNGPHDGV